MSEHIHVRAGLRVLVFNYVYACVHVCADE